MLRRRTALWIAAMAGVAVTFLLAFDVLDGIELPMRDLTLRLLPQRAAEATIVVAIDEHSLGAIGPWPWERATLAAIVNRAADAGARAVVLDVLLADARRGDEQLAAAARRLPVLAVAVLDERRHWLMPGLPLSRAMVPAHGNFELDGDGILRRLSATKQSEDRALAALSVEAASLMTGAPIPIGRSLAPAFRTRPHAIPSIPAALVLAGHAAPGPFRGKVVFVGLTAIAVGDRVLTPTSSRHLADPGVLVHAAATESIVHGDVIHELPPLVAGAAVALMVGAILLSRRRILTWAIIIITLIVGAVLLINAHISVPTVTFLASASLALGFVETRRVVSALRSTEAEFGDHRERDAEAKRVLAHELKTPLASMRSLTQLMNSFELSAAERHRVGVLLEQEAGKLESLVEALLDLERLPLRDFSSTSSVVDLGELVAARIDFLRVSTDRTLFVSADSEIFVRADSALIERVVDNLVGNALKYTEGPVIVRVERHPANARIEVEDRGRGIADADRDRIFQRFVRGTTAAGTEGLGLGLSMVAEIARWHGGSIAVEAAPGGGARFGVTLPLAIAVANAGAT